MMDTGWYSGTIGDVRHRLGKRGFFPCVLKLTVSTCNHFSRDELLRRLAMVMEEETQCGVDFGRLAVESEDAGDEREMGDSIGSGGERMEFGCTEYHILWNVWGDWEPKRDRDGWYRIQYLLEDVRGQNEECCDECLYADDVHVRVICCLASLRAEMLGPDFHGCLAWGDGQAFFKAVRGSGLLYAGRECCV